MSVGVLAVLGLSIAGCGVVSAAPTVAAQPSPRSVVLHGAGGDAAFPLYEEVGSALSGQGITLNYQLSSPGEALARFRAGQLSFLSSTGSGFAGNLPRIGTTGALYVPVGFSAVAVIYHLPSVSAAIRLSGKTLAGIYQGAIRTWDSRAIARENPGVRLPALPIAVVHGGPPSEATALVTEYLAAASKHWRRSVGAGASVAWPGGTAEGSDTLMEQAVAQTAGAIGYVEQPFGLPSGLRAADLLNAVNGYVGPTMRATSAVGDGPRGAGSLSLQTVNAPVTGAYPVVSETYVLVYRDLCQAGLAPRQAAATQRFLRFLLGGGQSAAMRLAFAPLPGGLRASALTAVSRLRCESQSI